jgi:hypothetical protein
MKKLFSIMVSAFAALVMMATSANAATNAKDVKDAKTVSSTEVHDKKGRLLYSVKRYSESQLPKEIRSLVRSQYYDYNIAGVEEITIPGVEKSIYIVHLEDETTLKIVKVTDGEMEVTASYVRG